MIRLLHNNPNKLLKSAATYAITHNTDFNNICKHIKSETQIRVQTDTTTKYEMKVIRKNVFKDLKDKYISKWIETMAQSKDSRSKITYKQLQKEYKLQPYIENIRTVPHKICISKLRLGCHWLRIQTGKYENNGGPIPVEERFCQQCLNNQIEDEKHLVLHCKSLEDIRKTYFESITQKDPSFLLLNDDDRAEYLLQANEANSCKEVGLYIFNIFKRRHRRDESK
jgi:hypothetical protein